MFYTCDVRELLMLSPLRLSLDPSPTTTVFFRRLIDYLRAAIHKSASYMPLADNDDEVDDDAKHAT